MADNTTGFEFNEVPGSPKSKASAVNLNNAVKKALIRNIAANAVKPAHIDPSNAGAGLIGGGGSSLAVNPDGETLEVNSDKVRIKDGGVGSTQIADGAITMDKLAEAVKTTINTVIKGIYKVGDYFITRSAEDPAKRFGGTWEKLENKTIIGASEEHAAGTEGAVELKCSATLSATLFGDNGDYAMVYSNGWCRQGGQRGGSGRHSWFIPFNQVPLAYGATAMGYGQQSTVGIAAELKTFLIAWVDNGNGSWRSPAFKWWAEGFIDMDTIKAQEDIKVSLPVSYEYIWRKISNEDAAE